MRSWRNVFLTWNAWTGKTYLIQKFISELKAEGKNVIVTAPTGIAAINAGWTTIHSTFKVFGYYPDNVPHKQQKVEWRKIDLLVIDEISMVWPDLLDYLDCILRKERKLSDPFGWLQTVVVWDKKQLPPVYVGYSNEDKTAIAKIKNKYWELSFDKAKVFESFETLCLTEPQRQKDPHMISLLNRIWQWDLTAIKEFKIGKWSENSVHIMPYNDMVDTHNYRELLKLPWKEVIYEGKAFGDFNEKEFTVPKTLKLKRWARVMLCKNYAQEWLVNWDTWIVISLSPDEIVFKSDRTWENYHFTKAKWEKKSIEWVEESIVWTYEQMPFKLAYAITVHKSQWLSFDDVCVHVTSNMNRELAYVAFSRCTNYENLNVNSK